MVNLGRYKFLGRDATRAFVTGDFSESGLVDDVSELGPRDLIGILDWVNFYEKGYELIGVVRGKYYDQSGRPTHQLQVQNLMIIVLLDFSGLGFKLFCRFALLFIHFLKQLK